jgi:hypothetical protein
VVFTGNDQKEDDMSLPGFTAEYSFYKKTWFYNIDITNPVKTYNTVVLQMDPTPPPTSPTPGESSSGQCSECYIDGQGNSVMHCCQIDTLTGTPQFCSDYPCSIVHTRAFRFDLRRFGGDPAPLVSRFRDLSSFSVRR